MVIRLRLTHIFPYETVRHAIYFDFNVWEFPEGIEGYIKQIRQYKYTTCVVVEGQIWL